MHAHSAAAGTGLTQTQTALFATAKLKLAQTQTQTKTNNKSKMKLEIGKRYIRRDGVVTRPLEYNKWYLYPFRDPANDALYSDDGLYIIDDESGEDLVAEYIKLKHEPEDKAGDLMADAARWRLYAESPQTAIMLGSKLDPCDKSTDWVAESNRLADEMIASRKERA